MSRKVLILILCNILLVWLLQTVNHGLSRFQWHLILPGLLITFPALNLKLAPALFCLGFSGLWMDAGSPAPFGLFTILFIASLFLVFRIRVRFHRENRGHALLLCHFLNFIVGFAMAVFLAGSLWSNTAYWLRWLLDMAASHLVLLFVATWYFQLQYHSLRLAGVDIYQDELENGFK